MDITRHNYEEYFLLYTDNELSAADRRAVEVFVQQNPDLEEELIMLQQSILQPDEKVVFEHKGNLMKDTARQGLVNENNYPEYFVLYGDDELTNQEKDLVEQFVYKYPQYQAEFELIQQARLYPDHSLIFPDKTYLYRTEQDDHKVVAFAWRRIAAAAVLLLAVGSLCLYIAVRETGNSTDGSIVVVDETTVPTNNGGTVAKVNKTEQVQPPVIKNTIVSGNTEKNSTTNSNIARQVNVQQEKRQVMTAKKVIAIKNGSRLAAKPIEISVVPLPATNSTTINDERMIPSATIAKVTNALTRNPVVESSPAIAVAAVMTEEKSDDKTYVLNTSVKKTPLRGFFRKVSRVVDKATSFEPDENKKEGVRIANFTIALK